MTDLTMPRPDGCWYVVVHEYPMSNSQGDTRTDYGIASSLHFTRDGAENQLAYCEGLQQGGQPGSEGRYFIAAVREEETR